MSALSEAVNALAAELHVAKAAERTYSDRVTDTADALDNIHAALVDLIDCAEDVVRSWDQ